MRMGRPRKRRRATQETIARRQAASSRSRAFARSGQAGKDLPLRHRTPGSDEPPTDLAGFEPVLAVGIVVLAISLVVERIATIRSAQLINAAGGDWSRDLRHAWEHGAPKWLSAVGLLSYAGVFTGIVLIVVAILG
jgi:hypothetical protein